MQLTIFTCPRPFVGATTYRQYNALASWCALEPRPRILLLGNVQGIRRAALRYGADVVPVEYNSFGTPYVSDVFRIAQDEAKENGLMMYANSDVCFDMGLVRALTKVCLFASCEGFTAWLATGRRLQAAEHFNIWHDCKDPGAKVGEIARIAEKWHTAGADWFAFTRGLWPDIPDFLLGRTKWDNWLIAWVRQNKLPIFNLSRAVVALHQAHGKGHKQQAAIEHNQQVYTLNNPGGHWGNIEDARWTMDERYEITSRT